MVSYSQLQWEMLCNAPKVKLNLCRESWRNVMERLGDASESQTYNKITNYGKDPFWDHDLRSWTTVQPENTSYLPLKSSNAVMSPIIFSVFIDPRLLLETPACIYGFTVVLHDCVYCRLKVMFKTVPCQKLLIDVRMLQRAILLILLPSTPMSSICNPQMRLSVMIV